MKRLWLGTLAVLVAVSATAFVRFGGWAVVSVQDTPEAWVAGRPLQLGWQVRQHGVTPLHDLRPTIEARSGARRVTGRAWAVNEGGSRGYRGAITLPDAGSWQVTIHSGFGRSRAVLVPMPVVDATAHADRRIVPLSAEERGRHAFAALGCVTCHTHRSVGVTGEVAGFGPDLTDRRFTREYLARLLADPSIKPPSADRQMPNPGLRARDIALLSAFLAGEQRLTRR